MQIPASLLVVVLPLGWSLSLSCGASEKAFTVKVSAGNFDRVETVASLPLPSGGDHWQMSDDRSAPIRFQVSQDRRGYFIVPTLQKGASATFRLTATKNSDSLDTAVRTAREGTRLKITVSGKPAFYYQTEPGNLPRPDIKPVYRRGGYIHPLLSPSGKLVTDDFPPNHVHHHGIWFPWTKTEFEGRQPDFWNMGEGKGTVEFVSLGETWSGPVFGGFQTRHRFIDLTAPQSKPALHEAWEVIAYNVGHGPRRFFLFDLVSTQECATTSPLKLPKYYYGGLGLRGNWHWNGTENAFFLTSEGETNRVRGNETRGRWCHIGGRVDGELTGVAVFCHPENFRAPQPMRLHPGEPFFCFAPSQLGDWEIAPGKSYVSRYRFVVADGPPDPVELERMWNDYAHPPSVEIKTLGDP